MATERYNAREAETRWQKVWDEQGIFATANADPRPKYYVLEMFPYPSGRIHMGHVRNYTMGDVVARFKRAMGFAVLHPMGWDAFGMPAENAAMERKVHPKAWTYENIAAMKAQLKSMGLSLDWAREIATCDPAYYKHQQKMFLDFLRAGLVERKQSKVNWDPVDQTVLANEQVIDGRGWRSGAPVEQRELTQWFFKITAFAQDLLDALDTLERWPDKVRLMQRNWIGRSEGLLVRFALDALDHAQPRERAGSLHHPPRHACSARSSWRSRPIIRWRRRRPQRTRRWRSSSPSASATAPRRKRSRPPRRKGFDTGMRALHPFDAGWKLPVYVANFILMEYGTGAIFGCPAHDQRDLDFARKYGLPVTPVVCPEGQDPATFSIGDTAYDGDGRMINSRFLDGMTIAEAKQEVARRLEARNPRQSASGPAPGQLPPARLGHLAPALLGLPDPDHPLRGMRRGAGAGGRPAGDAAGGRHLRPPGQSARPPPDLEARRLPAMRRAGAARDRHHGHLRRLVLVFRALHRSVERDRADRPQGRRPLAAGRSIYRRHRARDPAPALQPLLHPRHEGHRPYRPRRAVRRPVHPGHGGARDLSRQRRLGDARRREDRRRRRCAPRHARRHRRAGRDRRDREDVEVEAQHRRPRRHHGQLRRRHRALVHAVGSRRPSAT